MSRVVATCPKCKQEMVSEARDAKDARCCGRRLTGWRPYGTEDEVAVRVASEVMKLPVDMRKGKVR